MAISVVIPTHQRRHLLVAICERVAAEEATDDIVVVADGCTDGTQELVRRLAASDARMRLIDLTPNRGSQIARLTGVEAARNPVVLCLDDDVLPAYGTVGGHARHHELRDGLVVVGYMPVRLGSSSDVIAARYGERYERHIEGYEQRPEDILAGLWEGNVSFRRTEYLAAASRSGGLRHHEDQELGLRLRDLGCTAVFDRSLAAEHLFTRTLEQTLRDAWFSGVGYATLQPKYPHDLPPPTLTFAPERRLWRRSVVQAAAGPLRRPLTRTTRVALSHGQAPGARLIAGGLLGLLSRAQYLGGFLDTAGRASLDPANGPNAITPVGSVDPSSTGR